MNVNQASVFLHSYMIAAVWASTDDKSDMPLESLGFSIADLSADAKDQMAKDCTDFLEKFGDVLSRDIDNGVGNPIEAGTAFWLSRNGHGSGFFDGPWERGDYLQEGARAFGEQYIEIVAGRMLSIY